MQDLLLNQFFGPGYAEWACPLAISVKHSHIIPTVDVKGAQQALVFNGDVTQQETCLRFLAAEGPFRGLLFFLAVFIDVTFSCEQ